MNTGWRRGVGISLESRVSNEKRTEHQIGRGAERTESPPPSSLVGSTLLPIFLFLFLFLVLGCTFVLREHPFFSGSSHAGRITPSVLTVGLYHAI